MKVLKNFNITMLATYGISIPTKGVYNDGNISVWDNTGIYLIADINRIKRTNNDNKR